MNKFTLKRSMPDPMFKQSKEDKNSICLHTLVGSLAKQHPPTPPTDRMADA